MSFLTVVSPLSSRALKSTLQPSGLALSFSLAVLPGRSDWSDDMLGKGTLRPGKTAKLKLKAKPDGCKVDFSALLDNGETTVKKDIDLCADTPNVGF